MGKQVKSNSNSTFRKILSREQRQFNLIFIGTYIPRKCGIATYTKDLTNSINILNPSSLSEVMALDDPEREPVEYPWEVKYRIERNQEKDYFEAASYLNKSSCDFVCLQHEFGIFGGEEGVYILALVRNLKKPLVTTFHTALENPTQQQIYIINKIAQYSKACIVMIEEAAKRLKDIYQVPEEKIVVIHHGVPNIAFSPSDRFKGKIGFEKDEFLIGSINLISENKGLEYIIQAMPKIKKVIPKVKYLMIGQTHPLVKLYQKEKYRNYLKRLIKKLHLSRNFVEINRYLTLDELVSYLKAFDIYITPYLDQSQTASGTLAYAIGAGKVFVSTPYIYAKEILSDTRGILVNFRSVSDIEDAVIKIYKDPKLRRTFEKNAYAYGRKMIWPRVALDYLTLFKYLNSPKINS